MAWCCLATSYYLSQCWPSSMSLYGVAGPRVNNGRGREAGAGSPLSGPLRGKATSEAAAPHRGQGRQYWVCHLVVMLLNRSLTKQWIYLWTSLFMTLMASLKHIEAKMKWPSFRRQHFQMLKFIPKGPINTIPALVQIMARRQPSDRPLSDPMMIILLMHMSFKEIWFPGNIIVYYSWH